MRGRAGWAAALGNPPSTDYEALATLDPHRAYDVVMIAAPVFGRGGDAVVSLTLLGMEPGCRPNGWPHSARACVMRASSPPAAVAAGHRPASCTTEWRPTGRVGQAPPGWAQAVAAS